MTRVRYGWGIYDGFGALQYVSLDPTEHDAWTVFLGWPDAAEIEDAKRRGFKCVKVVVTPT